MSPMQPQGRRSGTPDKRADLCTNRSERFIYSNFVYKDKIGRMNLKGLDVKDPTQ